MKILWWVVLTMSIMDSWEFYNGCYDDERRLCVLCGCFEQGTEDKLVCEENEFIRMELIDNPMQAIFDISEEEAPCPLTKEWCEYRVIKKEERNYITFSERLEVYNRCTLQQLCTIRVKEGIRVVRYPYVCERDIIPISKEISDTIKDPVFYFTGREYVGENINWECTIIPKNEPLMELEIFFVSGSNMCQNVIFEPVQAVKCEKAQFYTSTISIENELRVRIRDLTAMEDDVLFFKVHGEVFVKCRFTVKTTPKSTTTTTQTPTAPPTTTTKTPTAPPTPNPQTPTAPSTPNPQTPTAPSTPNPQTPTAPPTTTTKTPTAPPTPITQTQTAPPTTAITQTSSNSSGADPFEESTTTDTPQNDRSNDDNYISKTEHQEKLNDTYALFGGIIAAIVVVGIVGVGIFCFIRRRKLSPKPSTEPEQPVSSRTDVSEQSPYTSLNDRQRPDGTENNNDSYLALNTHPPTEGPQPEDYYEELDKL